ncbi:MAG: YlxM family DNA-binding protein [Acutalibacteraceae bacterium]|nr:YlxM family DNA-binding protein [Acutalibacteraceae bacterium]
MNKKLIISLLLDFYGQLLSEKQLEIMDYYYNDDLSLREIADIVGITRQGVHDTIKRSEAFLEELENKLGLYSRWQSIQQQLELINTAVINIENENSENCKNKVIAQGCEYTLKNIAEIKIRF